MTNYSGSHLSVKARETLHSEPTVIMEMMSTLDPPMKIQRELSAEEFYQLMAFLQALISSSAVDLSQLVPESMPSGLQIWD